MQIPESSAGTRHRRFRLPRWLKIVLFVIVLGVGGVAAYFWYQNFRLDRELQSLIAEMDKNDPNWRLEEIEAARPPLPDEENAALQVIAAHKKLPKSWSEEEAWEMSIRKDPPAPNVLAHDWQVEELRTLLDHAKSALAVARKLRKYETGRYKIKWSEDWISTNEDDVQRAREVAQLLEDDVLVLAHEEKLEDAWQSCASVYRVSTSIGNADDLLFALIRIACRTVALDSMQRVLAQGTVDPQVLVETENMLREDLKVPLLWMGIRGQRAGQHRLFIALQAGKVEIESSVNSKDESWSQWMLSPVETLMAKSGHVYSLRWMTDMVAACKLPRKERLDRIIELEKQLETGTKNGMVPKFAGLLISTFADFSA